MLAVLKNISKKDKKFVSILKYTLEDVRHMQQRAVILDEKGYKKSADTIGGFGFDIWNHNGNMLLVAAFPGLGITCSAKLEVDNA